MKTYLTALSKYMGAVDPLCKEILYTCIVCSRREMLLPQKILHPWVCLCLLQSNTMYPCRVYLPCPPTKSEALEETMKWKSHILHHTLFMN